MPRRSRVRLIIIATFHSAMPVSNRPRALQTVNGRSPSFRWARLSYPTVASCQSLSDVRSSKFSGGYLPSSTSACRRSSGGRGCGADERSRMCTVTPGNRRRRSTASGAITRSIRMTMPRIIAAGRDIGEPGRVSARSLRTDSGRLRDPARRNGNRSSTNWPREPPSAWPCRWWNGAVRNASASPPAARPLLALSGCRANTIRATKTAPPITLPTVARPML